MFSSPNMYRGLIRLTTAAVANNLREWGADNGTNGYGFQTDGAVFGLYIRNAGVKTVVVSGAFNGSVSSFDPGTDVQVYEIEYSVQGVWFYINDVLIHSIMLVTTALTGGTTLPLRCNNVNSGGSTTNVILDTYTLAILRFDLPRSQPLARRLNANGSFLVKGSSASLHRIIVGAPGGTNNTLSVYDATSATGSPILVISLASSAVRTIECGFDCYTGVFAVLATGTAGDVTLVFD